MTPPESQFNHQFPAYSLYDSIYSLIRGLRLLLLLCLYHRASIGPSMYIEYSTVDCTTILPSFATQLLINNHIILVLLIFIHLFNI